MAPPCWRPTSSTTRWAWISMTIWSLTWRRGSASARRWRRLLAHRDGAAGRARCLPGDAAARRRGDHRRRNHRRRGSFLPCPQGYLDRALRKGLDRRRAVEPELGLVPDDPPRSRGDPPDAREPVALARDGPAR